MGSKGDSFRLCSGRGAQLAVQGRADPVTRDLGRTIDAARARHRRVGPLGGHHPPSLRHRDANPRRARSRLGPRRQPEQPETITTGNHRHQVNQPPQNPRLDRGVKDVLIVEGGTSRTGAERAGECDGLTGLPEVNAGGPGPRPRSRPVRSTRFRAPGCGSSPTGESRKVAAALKADLHRPEPGGRLAGSDRLLRVRHGGQVPPVTTWERFTPSSWTHRPMLRRVISPPTSWEVPPPPTASRLRATSCARITDEPRPLPLSMRP